MNLKIHAYNSYSSLQRRYNFCYRATLLSKVSLNLKIHAYNLEKGIVGYNGATNIVIALKILKEQEYFKSSKYEPENSCL